MVYKSTNITGTDHGDRRFRNVSIQVNIKHGDLIVLGTDGLFDNLSDEVLKKQQLVIGYYKSKVDEWGLYL